VCAVYMCLDRIVVHVVPRVCVGSWFMTVCLCLLLFYNLKCALQATSLFVLIMTFSSHSAAGPINGDVVSLVKCADTLPLEQYFAVITAHFQVHLACVELRYRSLVCQSVLHSGALICGCLLLVPTHCSHTLFHRPACASTS